MVVEGGILSKMEMNMNMNMGMGMGMRIRNRTIRDSAANRAETSSTERTCRRGPVKYGDEIRACRCRISIRKTFETSYNRESAIVGDGC